MRAFIIKRKGKTWRGNMPYNINIQIGNDEFYADYIFYRKKDAQKYLNTYSHKEFFEVIGVTIDKVKTDNRKTK